MTRHAAQLAGIVLIVLTLVAGCAQQTVTPVRTSFNKGVYQYSQENYDEAIADFREAVASNPSDYRSRFNLGIALEARAAELEAEGRAAEAKAMRSRAETAYRKTLEVNPGNVRAGVNLAALEYERGAREQAKRLLREMIAKHGDIALPRTALAARLMQEGDTAGAVTLLRDATRVEPANLMANYLLGEAAWKQGDVEGARAAFEKALLRAPDDIATLMSFGKLELERGNIDEAGVHFQSVLFVDPDHQRGHHFMAIVREKQGDYEGAVGHTWRAKALADDPQLIAAYDRKLTGFYQMLLDERRGNAQ